MSTVRFTRHAREDLLDIWLYIAPRSSDTVADQVYDRIEQTCQRQYEASEDPEKYYNGGGDWWQLSDEEESVFAIDRERFPRMIMTWHCYDRRLARIPRLRNRAGPVASLQDRGQLFPCLVGGRHL